MAESQNLHVSSHMDGEEEYIEIHIGGVSHELTIDDARWIVNFIEEELKYILGG